MELLKIVKKIAFEEIFTSYSLPTVVGINIEGTSETGSAITSEYVKSFQEWLDDIDADDFSYSYKRGPLNLLRDNSLNEIFGFFMDELKDYYKQKVTDYKDKKHAEALKAILEKAEAQQEMQKFPGEEEEENKKTSDPVIVKINFTDGKDGSNGVS